MLEIVNSFSDKLVLEKCSFTRNSKICILPFLLNIGKIDDLERCSIRNVCNLELDVQIHLIIFLKKLRNCKHIRIWFSSIDSEDYSLFHFVLYLIYKYKQDCLVSFVDVGLFNYYSIGCFDSLELENFLQYEKYLEANEIKKYADRWSFLMRENADLRLINEDSLCSYSYEYLDNKILEVLKSCGEIEKYRFASECMLKKLCSIYGDHIFLYRIDELIKNKKIKIVRTENKKDLIGLDQEYQIISIAN